VRWVRATRPFDYGQAEAERSGFGTSRTIGMAAQNVGQSSTAGRHGMVRLMRTTSPHRSAVANALGVTSLIFIALMAASCSHPAGLSPLLTRATTCMLGVLKQSTSVKSVRLSLKDVGGWNQPTIEYYVVEPKYGRTVVISADRHLGPLHEPPSFVGFESGLGGTSPDERQLDRRLEDECKVEVLIEYL
jgi:hypothetical protein